MRPRVWLRFFKFDGSPDAPLNAETSTAHRVAREMLARFDAELVFYPDGRPTSSRRELDVSISHCCDLGVIAIGRKTRVGVDIEKGYWTFGERFMDRAFSNLEKEFIRSTSQPERSGLMKVLWTQKEAWMKMSGSIVRPSTIHLPYIGVHAARRRDLNVATWLTRDVVVSLAFQISDSGKSSEVSRGGCHRCTPSESVLARRLA